MHTRHVLPAASVRKQADLILKTADKNDERRSGYGSIAFGALQSAFD